MAKDVNTARGDIRLESPMDILSGESDKKVVKLVYEEIRPNTVLLKPIQLLESTKSNLVSVDLAPIKSTNEEVVFEVLMAGACTDKSFDIELKKGDRVLVAHDYLHGVKHHPTSLVVSNERSNLFGYFAVPLAGVIARVSYSKL